MPDGQERIQGPKRLCAAPTAPGNSPAHIPEAWYSVPRMGSQGQVPDLLRRASLTWVTRPATMLAEGVRWEPRDAEGFDDFGGGAVSHRPSRSSPITQNLTVASDR